MAEVRNEAPWPASEEGSRHYRHWHVLARVWPGFPIAATVTWKQLDRASKRDAFDIFGKTGIDAHRCNPTSAIRYSRRSQHLALPLPHS